MEIMMIKIVNVLIAIAIFYDNISGIEAINATFHFKDHKSQNTSNKSTKKWQEPTSKQYEIFNIQWRMTKYDTASKKVYPNVSLTHSTKKKIYNKTTSHKFIESRNQNKNSFAQTHFKLNMNPSTPSFIEFYYMDDLDNKIRRKYTIKTNNSHTKEYKFAFLHAPFLLFRRDNATCTSSERFHTSTFVIKKSSVKTPFKIKMTSNAPTTRILAKSKTSFQVPYPKSIISNTFKSKIRTTEYDRIRFFEIYDSDTPKPSDLQQNKRTSDKDFLKNKENIYDIGDVGLDFRPFRRKLSNTNVSINDRKTIRRNIEQDSYSTRAQKVSYDLSQAVPWSDYPYVAVYVYEPEQVRCDCVSISPHWLIGAAACLYRYNKKNQEDSRSAFVTYCSSNWRLPGRIAYVSQCILHPQFHPKNYTRRNLYNIGAIQVVNSMSNTCNGWHPISLMSHHFVAEKGGTPVTVLGWGLDRYDTRYSVAKLPEHSLMMYHASVYSNFCPGHIGYSEAKRLNEASVKNVYCLSLPPYISEEHDPVHGSLLLMGGKLMALYSQEERRRWGEQSALYTGIWHLIPWLNDVAKEEEDLELFDSLMYKYSS